MGYIFNILVTFVRSIAENLGKTIRHMLCGINIYINKYLYNRKFSDVPPGKIQQL